MIVKKEIQKNKGLTRTVGIIIDTFQGDYSLAIVAGAVDAARQKKMRIVCLECGSVGSEINFHKNKLYQLLQNKAMDGYISLTASVSGDAGVDAYKKLLNHPKGIPFINIGATFDNMPYIYTDNESGMRQLVSHFVVHHGYTKIVFVRGPRNNPEAEIRFHTFCSVLKENNIPIREEWIVQSDFVFESELTNFIPLVENRKPEFEAVICCNDIQAIKAIKELNRRNIRVPLDIAVAGFDDSLEANELILPLTTVRQSTYDLGYQAIDMLETLMDGKQTANTVTIPSQLVIRRSCGCVQKTAQELLQGTSIQQYGISPKEFQEDATLHSMREVFIANGKGSMMGADKLNKICHLLVDKLYQTVNTFNRADFLVYLEDMLIETSSQVIDMRRWYPLLSVLFLNFIAAQPRDQTRQFAYELWNTTSMIVENITRRQVLKSEIVSHTFHFELNVTSGQLINASQKDDIKKILLPHFPRLGISNVAIYLYTDEEYRSTCLFLRYDAESGIVQENSDEVIATSDFLAQFPQHFAACKEYLVMSLFYQAKSIGIIVYQLNSIDKQFSTLYETLTVQISSAFRNSEHLGLLQKHAEELESEVQKRTQRLEIAKKELEDAYQKLTQIDELKNNFIANITHDFRSPLTAVLNLSELGLMEGISPGEMKHHFQVIFNASLKLKNTIDRLLEIAKMDSQGIKLKIVKLDIGLFLASMVSFYQSSIYGSAVQIKRDFVDNTVDDLYTDKDKLEEVLDNLLSNALKFIDPIKGEIHIGLQNFPDRVVICIEDNGIGIPQASLESIFNRFEQAHAGRNSKYRGSGIGLAFSKQIIEHLRGRIWAESPGADKGSQFFIELKKGLKHFEELGIFPEGENERSDLRNALFRREEMKQLLRIDLEHNKTDAAIVNIVTEPDEGDVPDEKKVVILIIDDDSVIREIVMKYLQNDGYKNFILASNGKAGLDAVYQYKPDMIISDYNMPGMRGDIFHDEVASNPNFSHIPFIFLSAIADTSVIVERKMKGASAFLKKPIDKNDLVLTVKYHLKKLLELYQLKRLATIDELTGLHNKKSLQNRLLHELAQRHYRDISVLFFDVDHFKTVNDTYGHKAGDLVLSCIGKIIRESIRPYDTAGRFGGDEFIILMPEAGLKQAGIVGANLNKKVKAETFEFESRTFSLTLSIGVASLRDPESKIGSELGFADLRDLFEVANPESADWDKINILKSRAAELLLNLADKALYQAKKTHCLHCGFQSEKETVFENRKCPQCGSLSLKHGRDQVVLYHGETSLDNSAV